MCAAALPGCAGGTGERELTAFERALQPALRDELAAAPDLETFYRANDYRPLWLTGEGRRPEAADALLRALRAADAHLLDPARYSPDAIEAALAAAKSGDRAAIARAELALSRAFAAYISDLRTPAQAARLAASHRALEENGQEILTAAAAAPSLADHIAEAQRMHPIYEGLRNALASGGFAATERALLRVNLERARVLPGEREGRYVLVDIAAQRLWLYEDGEAQDYMRVAVGMPRHATPAMSGLISHATVNPYWNLPPDLVRDRARRVLREGTAVIRREQIELLDGWAEDARVLQPEEVDWTAVAARRQTLRMRQLPGGDNVMGRIKFMMPNPLGIYLHDTPDKGAFGRDDRRLSSGCVRVEDAGRLADWLFESNPPPMAIPGAEQRFDLPAPVPVYIVYLTAAPDSGGIEYRRDIYGRDPALLAGFRNGTSEKLRSSRAESRGVDAVQRPSTSLGTSG